MVKKSHTRTNKKVDYQNFLKHLSLVDLGLIESSSKFLPDDYMKLRSEKSERATISIGAEYDLKEAKERYFEVVAKFKLNIVGTKTKTHPVSIECSFLAHFHTKESVVKDLAERFTNIDFKIIAWPYFRQFIHDVTARMSIPPLLIPLSLEEA
ncbi:MAG TPA: hypothetical protein VH815_03285 [Acidobacteriota bacterium]